MNTRKTQLEPIMTVPYGKQTVNELKDYTAIMDAELKLIAIIGTGLWAIVTSILLVLWSIS